MLGRNKRNINITELEVFFFLYMVWTDFDQYDEDDKFFYLKNDSDKVCA